MRGGHLTQTVRYLNSLKVGKVGNLAASGVEEHFCNNCESRTNIREDGLRNTF